MKEFKLYEVAQKLDLPAKDLVSLLKDNGFKVSNVMSKIKEEDMAKVEEIVKTKGNIVAHVEVTKETKPAPKKQADDNKKPRNNANFDNKNKKDAKPRVTTKATVEIKQDIAVEQPETKNTKVSKNKAKDENKKHEDVKFSDKEDIDKIIKKDAKKAEKDEPEIGKVLKFAGEITVNEMAKKLNLDSSEIIKTLFLLGKIATINHTLEADEIEILASEFGFEVEEEILIDETDLLQLDFEDDPKDLVERAPIITIMGHVDHGKTSLLDYIRNTKVTSGEAGGITQHIGAYSITHEGHDITFLDTPGHEAFTAMRARGAAITDITVLVVAADDSVMPQTIEAIDHSKAAGVPIIVAINKIDRPESNPEKIKGELMEHGIISETWGGDNIMVEISAKTGQNIDELLSMILLQSEMLELKANPKRNAFGTVLEARLDKGRGVVATLLVQKGTLKHGDPIVTGHGFGKVRTMADAASKKLKNAIPSHAVEITGLNVVPNAGDLFISVDSEKEARSLGENIIKKVEQEDRKVNKITSADALFGHIEKVNADNINVIIKADVKGSAEALKASLLKINVDGVHVNVLRSTVGGITESDVLLASTSGALIIGFNTRADSVAREAASNAGVEIINNSIIYKIIEEIEARMKGMLSPIISEKIIGHVAIREIFTFNKMNIAGCYVEDGLVRRDAKCRLVRDGIVIYDTTISTLKREKNDAREVTAGLECGLTLDSYNDIKIGDEVEVYEEVETAAY